MHFLKRQSNETFSSLGDLSRRGQDRINEDRTGQMRTGGLPILIRNSSFQNCCVSSALTLIHWMTEQLLSAESLCLLGETGAD